MDGRMVKEVQHATGNNPICPCVEDVIEQMFVGAPNEKILLRETSVSKGRKVLEKLNQDESERLFVTLCVMRACRLLDDSFVANTPLITLLEEIVQLNRIPACIGMLEDLKLKLPNYQTLAKAENEKENRMELWLFWVAHILNLPSWFSAAENVALIQPSSGCSERVFAMATNIFDETKASTLEDRKEGTVMIRMNQNWRQSEMKQFP
jgi:hypothetical protein